MNVLAQLVHTADRMPHTLLPYISDWSSKDWGSNKAKTKEQKSLTNFKPPKQDNDKETDQQTDIGKVADVHDIPFQNLTFRRTN